jgi:hypothetical protein
LYQLFFFERYKSVGRRIKTATREFFPFAKREGTQSRGQIVSRSIPFFNSFFHSTYNSLMLKRKLITFYVNLQNNHFSFFVKEIKLFLLLLFLSGRAFRQREKGGGIVLMRFLITIVQFTPPPLPDRRLC